MMFLREKSAFSPEITRIAEFFTFWVPLKFFLYVVKSENFVLNAPKVFVFTMLEPAEK